MATRQSRINFLRRVEVQIETEDRIITVNKLRVSFNINKKAKKSVTDTKITIYGLHIDNEKAIKQNDSIVLFAGNEILPGILQGRQKFETGAVNLDLQPLVTEETDRDVVIAQIFRGKIQKIQIRKDDLHNRLQTTRPLQTSI